MLNLPKARVYGAAVAPTRLDRDIAGRLCTSWRGASKMTPAGSPGAASRPRRRLRAQRPRGRGLGRFDDYARAGRTVVRVLGMLGAPPWVGRSRLLAEDARLRRGAEAIVAEANAPRPLRRVVPLRRRADRHARSPAIGARAARGVRGFCQAQPGVVPQLVNEAVPERLVRRRSILTCSSSPTFAASWGTRTSRSLTRATRHQSRARDGGGVHDD
jgi:hypothetical protein